MRRFFGAWRQAFPGQHNNPKFLSCLDQVLGFIAERASGQRLPYRQVALLVGKLLRALEVALVNPGEAVGALAAQGLGEPCTQMTLKTFHFAGVASMNVTLGVPRIKEIFNASEHIATPIIEVRLRGPRDSLAANFIKNRINAVFLGDILDSVEEVYDHAQAFLLLRFSPARISAAIADFQLEQVRQAILKAKLRFRDKHVAVLDESTIRLDSPLPAFTETMFFFKRFQSRVHSIVVHGLPTVKRAILSEKKDAGLCVFAEGTGLFEILRIPGVDFARTTSNNIREVREVLGVEAARAEIIEQIKYTISIYGISIDYRHVSLLADVMSHNGGLIGLNRYGITKMKNSPLMLASFEKTGEILFDAAFFGTTDPMRGVSEKIMIGENIQLGTGKFDLLAELP